MFPAAEPREPIVPSRLRRLSLAAAAVALAAAAPAGARVIDVGAERNIGVFHSIDFVAAFGGAPGTVTTVEVLRNGQVIGTATGPAVSVGEFPAPNDGGLEVNHGPEGAPQPGDCWDGFTPDIIPGDRIRVTRPGEVDEIEIDRITIDEGPLVESGDVVVRGTAALAGGAPIDIADLDSGEVRNGSDFRGAPTRLFRTPGTTDGWTAIYDTDVALERERNGPHTPAERTALLLAGDHAMGFGHVAPLPPETQLFEGGETPGPAPGCDAAPGQSNAVSATDDAAYNTTSGDLVVTGRVMAGTVDDDITRVVPRVSDGTRTITGAAVDVAGDVQAWTATFTRAQLDTLADGTLRVAADYVTSAGAIGGKTLRVPKDVVAPDVTPDQAPGAYTAPLSVALSAGPGEKITYRTDGLPNSANDRAYTGPIVLAAGTTTISVRVTDPAGNFVDRAFTYTLADPPPPAAPAAPAAVTPVLAPPAIAALAPARSLSARALRAARRVRARTARRAGLRVSFVAPEGARVAVVRLYRTRDGRRVLVGRRTLAVRGGARHAVRFRPARRALYLTDVRVGPDAGALGTASQVFTRVIR